MMISMGVPMIVAGDEFKRSQGGNNNTYCHDNEINWFNWDKINSSDSQEMIRFWSKLINKRLKFKNHFSGRYFAGRTNRFNISDIHWHGPIVNQPGWDDPQARCLAFTLGDTADDTDGVNNIHVMMNMYWDAIDFEIPQFDGLDWYRSIDTSLRSPEDIVDYDQQVKINDQRYVVTGRSIVVLLSRETT
jgi:glycogen operon protein